MTLRGTNGKKDLEGVTLMKNLGVEGDVESKEEDYWLASKDSPTTCWTTQKQTGGLAPAVLSIIGKLLMR